MARYTGNHCPVCEQAFTDDDDIVVCPDCGTPYHRACWQKVGVCMHQSEHAAGFEWKPEFGPEAEAAAHAAICPNCGTYNEPGAARCSHCGVPLPRPEDAEQQAPHEEGPIYARTPIRPPHFMGKDAKVDHSMVTSGCEVYGTVENSVLFHSVTVEEGAVVRYSILMPGTVVKKGAVVEYAIVAEESVIGENARVGASPDGSEDWGVAVIAQHLNIGPSAVVSPKAMITRNVKGGGVK